MKLIEALKNLKTIEKRIDKNCQLIADYSAYVSSETPVFETHEKQQKEVESLIQANCDLEKEYIRLKMCIDHTNLNTKVQLLGKNLTISELVTLQRLLNRNTNFRQKTYNSLNMSKAQVKLQQVFNQKGVDAQNPARVIPVYSEAEKNKALREWEEFTSQIDGKLEVVNAETELLTLAA